MISLKESLLGDLDANLAKGDEMIEKNKCFGGRFKFYNCVCNEASASILSSVILKKLTKNMDYMNPKIEHGQFDKKDKIKMFANWLDHVSFKDIDFNPFTKMDKNDRQELSDKLVEYCKKQNLFNCTEDGWHLWIGSIYNSGPENLAVLVNATRKGASATFRLMYNIEKL